MPFSIQKWANPNSWTRTTFDRADQQLRNVAAELAEAVADGLGMTELPPPLPKVLKRSPPMEIEASAMLSLLARPGSERIKTRHIALLVADGVDGEAALALHTALADEGAVPRFVGVKLGQVESKTGDPLDVEVSLETAPSAIWDAAILVDGVEALRESGHALEFVKDQYRHCKPILVVGAARAVLEQAGIPMTLPSGEEDPSLLVHDADQAEEATRSFIDALAKHRHFERETDPPRV